MGILDNKVPTQNIFGSPPPSLNPVENGFLGLLGLVDRMGGAATSLHLYNDAIQRGRTAPITETDFQPSELEALRSLVTSRAMNSERTVGHVDYRDYPLGGDRSKESGELMNTLGGFNYAIQPNGGINVTDKYDFNADRGDASDNNMIVQALGSLFNPRGLAAAIGRKVLPDNSGRGIPVNIYLPPK